MKAGKSEKMVKTVLVKGFVIIDALDAYEGLQSLLGSLSLDHGTFRNMFDSYNEVVLTVDGDRLEEVLCGKYQAMVRMKAARDPAGRMDAIDVISLKTLDGLKKIAARIPTVIATSAHSASAAAVPITGLLQDFKGEGLQWVTVPPFSPSSAFISLWGFGLAKEFGGRLVMHSPEPELEAELDSIVRRHGIWGLDGVYGGSEGQLARISFAWLPIPL